MCIRDRDNTWVLIALFVIVVAAGVVWFQDAGNTAGTEENTTELSSEAERFWHLAKVRRRERDFASEQRLLIALRDVLAGTSDHKAMQKLIEKRLVALRQDRRKQAEGFQLARDALDRAEKLTDQQKWEEASRIVAGVIELYGNEPGAATLIENANRLQEKIETAWDSAASPE